MSRRRNFHAESVPALFERIKADYEAARTSNYRRSRSGLPAASSGADWHYRSQADYLRLMELARDMDRNDVVAGQAVNRAVDNTIQGGFTLDVKTPDPKLNADLMAEFAEWADDPLQCDVQGRMTFHAMERMTFRHRLVDGDMLAIPTRDGSLQLVEGHRLRTPTKTTRNVVGGVLISDQRRPIEYWLTKDDINPLSPLALVGDTVPYPAIDSDGEPAVFHMLDPKRISQTRGVTAFAPIFPTAAMVEDIHFAKLVQQQVCSMYAILRERPVDANIIGDPVLGSRETEQLTGGYTRQSEGIAPGMEYIGDPGETLKGFSAAVPNQEFFSHMRLELQLIAINLGLPLICFLLDASQTNFSGWRGAMDQAKIGFRWNQQCHRSQFHRNVWRWWIRRKIASDPPVRAQASRMGLAVFRHEWGLPCWPYIEPRTDAEADAFRIDHILVSPRRQQSERGQDWMTTAKESVEDKAAHFRIALDAARAINEAYPEANLNWRELAGVVTSETVIAKQNALGDDAPADGQPGGENRAEAA